jgi:beta-lactamase class A
LSQLLTARPGTFGVLIEHLPTGQRFAFNADRPFAAASVYKAWLAYKVLRDVDLGRIDLDDALTIEAQDATEPEPDSDVALGDELTVRAALQAMMGASSNAAAHSLLRLVGRSELNEALAALSLRSTQVPVGAGQSGETAPEVEAAAAMTTAHDSALLFRRLATERLLSEASRQQLWRLLALPEDLDPIAPRLPAGADIRVKLGNLEDASNAAGLIDTPTGPLVVSIFDERVDPGVAREVIADLVEQTYRHYQSR